MANRPILFFDTSVCIDVTRGKIPPSEWKPTWKLISRNYRYRISPFTVYELLAGLATGDDRKFDKNREPLRVLFPAGQKKILPALRVFMAKQLFNDDLTPHPDVPDINRMLRITLQAPARQALETERVRSGGGRFGLDLSNVNRQLREIENGYVKRFREFKRLRVPKLTPEVWAEAILTSYGKEVTPTNRSLVLQRLDAAYRFDAILWKHAADPKYNIAKHRDELVDAHQLYYLVDSHAYLLTSDARLRNRVATSSQSDRVLTPDTLIVSSK